MQPNHLSATTVDPEEVERFSRIADEWWDERGKFKPLHVINPLRLGYIRDHIVQHFGLNNPAHQALQGVSLLDIGCGGGLIAEPLAKLGAHVTAIDASEKNIAVAKLHAERQGVAVDYHCATAETLQQQGERFQVVLALEIIEHVADPQLFMQCVLGLVRPGGIAIVSTLNRTAKSFALAIVGAEYVLRWLPRGTHIWRKFIRPSELAAMVRANGGELAQMCGMVMHPLTFEWRLSATDLDVNYLMVIKKD